MFATEYFDPTVPLSCTSESSVIFLQPSCGHAEQTIFVALYVAKSREGRRSDYKDQFNVLKPPLIEPYGDCRFA